MSIKPGPTVYKVTLRDEKISRSDIFESYLQIRSLKLTARELITERVRAENDRQLLDAQGKNAPRLVAPDPGEKVLNSHARVTAASAGDAKDALARQIKLAVTAFESNGFILLVDDRQIEDLEHIVEINDKTVVTFLRLTPLVGG